MKKSGKTQVVPMNQPKTDRRGRDGNRGLQKSVAVLVLLTAALMITGCQPNERILKSAESPTPKPTLEPRKTDIETDIREMGTARLDYVFVVRRKDGGLFNDEDKRFLRENMPREMNRTVSADEGRAFVLGTAFLIPKETVDRWRSRFSVEERSAQKPVNSQ